MLAIGAHFQFIGQCLALSFVQGLLYALVAEALPFSQAQQVDGQRLDAVVRAQRLVGLYYAAQLIEEPAVDAGEAVYLVHTHPQLQGLGNHKDARVGRFTQCLTYILYGQRFIAGKAYSSLPYHTQTFLHGLLKGAAYTHHLAYRLHARAYLTTHMLEFIQVPAGYLTYYIV